MKLAHVYFWFVKMTPMFAFDSLPAPELILIEMAYFYKEITLTTISLSTLGKEH